MPMEVNDPSKNIVQNVLFPSEFGSILTSYSKWLSHTHSTKRNWENLQIKINCTSVKAHLHVPEIKYKIISQKHLWKKGLLCYTFIFEKFFFKWSYNNVN